ncbi:MAG: VOC family protein [Rhodospirillaceae bacterium]|nr:VOC family protein [Rhodospirillaceae bacterium]
MREGIQGLGWFVRRSAATVAVGRFYRDALALPVLRQWEQPDNAGFMLYGGDVAAFEINRGGQPPSSDPALAECTPIFRSRDMDTSLRRATVKGAHVTVDENTGAARTVFLADPQGHAFGFQSADSMSPQAHHVEAQRRWDNADHGLPGVGAMPADIQDITCVRLRVEDPVALAAFYSEMLGLDVIGTPSRQGAMLHVGGTCALELVPGGTRRAPPKDRVDVTDVWILRIYDYVGMKAHLAVNRVHCVNTVQMIGGWLDYYTDPEGHLFGFQERKPADPAVPNTNLIEDIAARKRWEAR